MSNPDPRTHEERPYLRIHAPQPRPPLRYYEKSIESQDPYSEPAKEDNTPRVIIIDI